MEEFFFFLFCPIQRVHELHHVGQTLVGIIRGEDDTVDAESLLGTLKGDFRHNATGCHDDILVLEVVGNLVLHLHLLVLDPLKAVVHPADDEREVFATMAENHSQLGELVEGAVQNQSQRRLHGMWKDSPSTRVNNNGIRNQ